MLIVQLENSHVMRLGTGLSDQMPSTQCPASVKNASFGVVSRKQSSLVVTLSSKEATGSVIEANLDPRGTRPLIFALFDVHEWRTDRGPDWTVRSFASGHRGHYAAVALV
jgi:hypothetical protein